MLPEGGTGALARFAVKNQVPFDLNAVYRCGRCFKSRDGAMHILNYINWFFRILERMDTVVC
jgi:hypothetical protein